MDDTVQLLSSMDIIRSHCDNGLYPFQSGALAHRRVPGVLCRYELGRQVSRGSFTACPDVRGELLRTIYKNRHLLPPFVLNLPRLCIAYRDAYGASIEYAFTVSGRRWAQVHSV